MMNASLIALACTLCVMEPMDESPKHTVYLELGGNALFYSVNYERAITNWLSLSVGGSALGVSERGGDGSVGWFMLPLMVHTMWGWRAHHVELSIGFTPGLARGDLNEVGTPRSYLIALGTGFAGYRYQPESGGLMGRVGVTPVWGGYRFAPLGNPLQLWGGASIGWSF